MGDGAAFSCKNRLQWGVAYHSMLGRRLAWRGVAVLVYLEGLLHHDALERGAHALELRHGGLSCHENHSMPWCYIARHSKLWCAMVRERMKGEKIVLACRAVV